MAHPAALGVVVHLVLAQLTVVMATLPHAAQGDVLGMHRAVRVPIQQIATV